MKNEIIQGDALSILKTLPDEYIQTIITSPPYYSLRDYQVDGQIGQEDTPEEYIQNLVEVFREARRVLRKDGTSWINIGDNYAGSGKGPTGFNGVGNHEIRQGFDSPKVVIPDGLKPKDLMMIPARLAIALQQDGWYLRSEIIWNKLNCLPESVEDRPTKSHEKIYLLSKSATYYYDAEAIKEPAKDWGTRDRSQGKYTSGIVPISGGAHHGLTNSNNAATGRNKRSVWDISTLNYSEAHFATFPPKLVEPCILAGSSSRACEQCGAPWKRSFVSTGHVNKREPAHTPNNCPTKTDSTGWAPTKRATDDWQPTCKCINKGTGKSIVLDPFMGSGTVGMVANQYGRDWLGIELNPSYIKLAEVRTAQQGLWTVENEAAS